MKQMAKRFVAYLCVISMLISMVVFAQASGVVAVVGNAKLIQGSGEEEVQIPIELSGNTGIAGMTLKLSFTEGITLNSITKGDALPDLTMTKPGKLVSPCNIVWDGQDADTTNGTIVTLTFNVPKGTVKDYQITVTPNGVFDNDVNDVNLSVTNGKISVEEKPKENFTGLSIADATYTYDGTEKSLAVLGVPEGATVTYTSDDFDADGKAIDAGIYNITATVKKDGYNDWSKEAKLTIKPKTVSVTGLVAVDKTYDGTNKVALTGGIVSGIVARDSSDQYCDEHESYRIKCSIPENGVFADANVGNDKTVTIDEIELTGCSADNYELSQPTGLKADIKKAPITVKAKDATIKTGAPIPTFNEHSYEITVGKLFGNDQITGNLQTNCNSTAVAKEFSITQGTLTAGGNYDLSFINGKLSVINKTIQNVTVDGVVSEKTYGDTGFKVTVTPDANSKLDNFEFASTNTNVATIDANGNVTIKGAGTTTISVKEAGNADYAPFEKVWTLTVNKAKITITANNVTKKIGRSDPEFTYVVTGSLVGSDVITGKLARKPGESVGRYDILIGTLAISDNYDITFNKGVFEIVDKTPQAIVVSDIETKTYGDASFKVNVTPDANSGLTAFTFASSNTNVATIDSEGNVTIKAAGTTDITVKQAGNDEYAAFEKKQTLNVNKVAITVTADAKSKRIGKNDPKLTYSYAGNLVGTDVFTGELTRENGETAGKYDILQGTLTLTENYDITYNKAVFEILEKEPQNIVLADIPTKTYGDGEFALDVTPDDESNLTNFTYVSDNTNVATIDETGDVTIVGAGEAVISVTEAGNDDYAKTTVAKTLVVNKKGLEIKVDDVVITYGDEINTDITYTGFITGENENVLTKQVKLSGYLLKPNAGEYDVILSGAEADNYEISYVNAKLIVNKKNATLTQLNVFDKVADDTTNATVNMSSLVIDGMILGDDLTVDYEAATFASADVGTDITVKITGLSLSGEHAGNYNLTGSEFVTTASIKEAMTAADIAAQITSLVIAKDATAIDVPNVPEGYKIVLKSSDNEAVIKTDGSVAPVETDTQVGLVFTVTNEVNETDTADTALITAAVPASSKVLITVTAEENGTATGNGEYLKNSEVTIEAIADSDYAFSGWYESESLISANATYTFKAERDLELIAKFTKKTSSGGGGGAGGGGGGSSKPKPEEPKEEEPTDEPATDKRFIDLGNHKWAEDAIYRLVALGVINGTSENTYSPGVNITRADFTTLIVRAFKFEAEVATFSDVDSSKYYANPIGIAKTLGIVNGVNATDFAPTAQITRQDMMVIIYRALKVAGIEIEKTTEATFSDAADVSAYALEAVEALTGAGLIAGSGGKINPKANTTRAEVAVVLDRILSK